MIESNANTNADADARRQEGSLQSPSPAEHPLQCNGRRESLVLDMNTSLLLINVPALLLILFSYFSLYLCISLSPCLPLSLSRGRRQESVYERRDLQRESRVRPSLTRSCVLGGRVCVCVFDCVSL